MSENASGVRSDKPAGSEGVESPVEAAKSGEVAESGEATKREKSASSAGQRRFRQPVAQGTLKSTNVWSTKQLVTMALMCAIGVLLSFVEFPLVPGVAWLRYDASIVPAMVCGFAYGPGAGLAVGIVGAGLHGLLAGDLAGAAMNILVVLAYVLVAALIYRRFRSFKGAACGLALGSACAVAAAIAGNLVVTPLWAGIPLNAVVAMIVPALLPFNLVKSVLNSVLTLAAYKAAFRLLEPNVDA